MSRNLLVVETEPNYFTVIRDGVSVADKLGKDEACYVCALFFVAPEKTPPYTRKIEDAWEIDRRIREDLSSKANFALLTRKQLRILARSRNVKRGRDKADTIANLRAARVIL